MRPILIIGPYLLKKDTISKTPWGDIDLNKYDYVNQSRKDVQNLLLESINRFDNIILCVRIYENIWLINIILMKLKKYFLIV